MEEYKYKLIRDYTSDENERLKAFVDALDMLGRKYLYSAELYDRVLTLTWCIWVPGAWRRRQTVKLSDDSDRAIEHVLRDEPRLSPSLESALRFFTELRDTGAIPAGDAPDNLMEKLSILEHNGFIEVGYDIQFHGISPLGGPDATAWYSQQMRDYAITQTGRDYLERTGA